MHELGDTKENWREWIRKAQKGDKAAQEKLVKENMGLIYMVQKRFLGRGYDMEDLFQIGAIGLLKAIARFDTDSGFAFSTYAVPMIIGEIQRFMRDDGLLHISRKIKDNSRKIAKAKEKWKKLYNRELTLLELQNECQLSLEEIMEALESMSGVESLDGCVPTKSGKPDEGTQSTWMDTLMDETCSEEKIVNRIAIEQAMQGLSNTERRLLLLRYMEGKTQVETAKILQMNQVAVSRLEKKILLQMRSRFDYNEVNTKK